MTFNPFTKPLNDLTSDDLNLLISGEISEGYWIEFKSVFQPGNKIAKSIASFANSFGGWYFIGVVVDKDKNVATNICGFDLNVINDPISKLRDSIKAYIDPIPVFFSKLINIGIDKAVLVVQVPDNQETPFITKDGRIYRRVSDLSDPVPEGDRYAVDRLVDNGRELEKRFEEFCTDDRVFSDAEKNQSWINIYLSPYPLGSIERYDMFESDGIEKLIKMSQSTIKIFYDSVLEIGSGNFPLNSGQLGVGSVILRQVEPSKVAFNSTTVQFFTDGKAKLFIPVKYVVGMHTDNLNNFKSIIVRKAFQGIIVSDKEYSTKFLHFFDIMELWAIVTNLLNLYQEWFGKTLQENSVRIAITMNNIWRLIPFCDADVWGSHVMKFGLPAQNVDFIRFPIRKGKGKIATFPIWKMVCPVICTCFGLPMDIFINTFLKANV